MTAREAYRIIREDVDGDFSAESCREYSSFFMFFAGGINVICVNKNTGKLVVSELRQMPKENWRIVEI